MVCLFCLVVGIATAAIGALFWYSLPRKIKFVLQGKHVFITGGSKGIGKEIAAEVIAKGAASVSIAARSKGALEKAANELQDLCEDGQVVRYYVLDVTSGYETVKSVIDQAAEDAGTIDVLINNAGMVVQGGFTEVDVDSFEKQVHMNYVSAAHASRAVIDGMKRKGSGHIAFVSSAAGQCAIWGYSAYSPSKFAVRGFAEALHMELLPFNIGVSVLYPPNTETEGYEEEIRTMPEEVRLIGGSAGLFSAKAVAKQLVQSIENGTFITTVGFEGWMLGALTAGAAPEPDFLNAALQTLFGGLFRGIMLVYIGSFNRIVQQCHAKKQGNDEKTSLTQSAEAESKKA
uniref:3-dehydrosphinganine reductase n=1 Tax=Panagrellus redivivus TaxID=6233 RepID=A0A7E4VW46_PANRE